MLEIVKDLSKLNEFCSVTTAEDESKLQEMLDGVRDVLYANEEMVALSAPQVGINKRFFCIKFANGDVRTYINPMVKKQTGTHLSRETSPTIPEKEFIKLRSDTIELAYQTPTGKVELNAFEGAVSEIVQQMMDSIDGIPLNVMALEVLPGWDEATEEERQEVIDAWFETLKKDKESIQDEINNDPELKEMNDAINYMKGVQTGEIKTYREEPTLNREQRRALAKMTKTPFLEVNKMVKNKKR